MTASSLVGLLLWLLLAPAAVGCLYLLLLTLLSGRRAAPVAPPPTLRFDFVVPAHDEEAGIAATVKSLLAVAYPRELFRVVVVADNCSDATAARAAEAGAQVLVRQDKELRGKGYALAHAFERSLQGNADAVVVVDADTVVSANLLTAFSTRLAAGAWAAQAHYGVRNPEAAWRTRLLAIALGMFHQVRSLGRERLGVSCGLRGNGMCFSRRLLVEIPHQAFSLVEDVEYGLRVGEAGHRVFYAGEAHVLGEMVAGEKASRSQRQRWEQGRLMLMKQHGVRLLKAGLAKADPLLLDLALDILVPPLSVVALLVASGLTGSIVLQLTAGGSGALVWAWAACAFALFLYGARGWQLSGTGARGLLALLAAPFYVVWKLAVLVRGRRKGAEWVRTTREGSAP